MPVDFLQQRKRQKYLVPITIAVIVITVLILWFGYFKEEKAVFLPVEDQTGTVFREIKIDFSVLENPFLKELQSFIKITPFEGKTGRENPFVPY